MFNHNNKPDVRVVENGLGTFVIAGEQFSRIAMSMADATEGEVKRAIDEMLGGEGALIGHPGERLIAANRLLRERRPDLWAAAERLGL